MHVAAGDVGFIDVQAHTCGTRMLWGADFILQVRHAVGGWQSSCIRLPPSGPHESPSCIRLLPSGPRETPSSGAMLTSSSCRVIMRKGSAMAGRARLRRLSAILASWLLITQDTQAGRARGGQEITRDLTLPTTPFTLQPLSMQCITDSNLKL